MIVPRPPRRYKVSENVEVLPAGRHLGILAWYAWEATPETPVGFKVTSLTHCTTNGDNKTGLIAYALYDF